jgi:hypothetical protein
MSPSPGLLKRSTLLLLAALALSYTPIIVGALTHPGSERVYFCHPQTLEKYT